MTQLIFVSNALARKWIQINTVFLYPLWKWYFSTELNTFLSFIDRVEALFLIIWSKFFNKAWHSGITLKRLFRINCLQQMPTAVLKFTCSRFWPRSAGTLVDCHCQTSESVRHAKLFHLRSNSYKFGPN